MIGSGVGILVLHEGKVLLGRKHHDNAVSGSVLGGENTWSLPGGKIEFHEQFEEAALRELKEEAGISVEKVRVISVNNDRTSDKHFLTVGLLGEGVIGEPQVMEPDKIVEWKWFSLNALPDNLYMPSEKLIKNYLSGSFYIPEEQYIR